MITIVYLEDALVPHARKVIEVESTTIGESAPTMWVRPFVAFLDGKPVLRKDWSDIVPNSSSLAFIEVGALPQGGGGGGGSDPLRMVLMIAVMVYAPQVAFAMSGAGAGLTGAALAAAQVGFASSVIGMASTLAISMVGMALVNAVLPVQTPNQPTMHAMNAPSPTYNVAAQGNSARLEAAIPEHFGKLRVFPDFAAQPYTEYEGNEQYLYQLLCIGRGEYNISSIKLEDSLLSSFDEATTYIVPPNTRFTNFPTGVSNVGEVSGQELDNNFIGPFIINSSGTTINQINLDFVAPGGLYYATDDGSLAEKVITVEAIADRIDDTGNVLQPGISLGQPSGYTPWSDWMVYSNPALLTQVGPFGKYDRYVWVQGVPANTDLIEYQAPTNIVYSMSIIYAKYRTRQLYTTPAFKGATNTQLRWTMSTKGLLEGRYQVKVRRTDTKDTSTRAAHSLMWAGARGYHPMDAAQTYGDCTLLAIKIRATNNISVQSSRKVNLIAERKLPTWNGTSWTGNVVTRSPMWALTYVCKQAGLTDNQLDLAAMLNIHNTRSSLDCFDGRFDNFVSLWDAITRICFVTRTKAFLQGGIIRVVRDQQINIPVAMFSTRNIVKGSLSIDYLIPNQDTTEVVDAKYFDETLWQPATVSAWVKVNGVPATKPYNIQAPAAKVDMFGITNRDQAYREGLYHAANNKYRRKLIKFQTEMEGFIPSYGDLINIQHDMPGWGQSGEVIGVVGTTLSLSEALEWGTGTHYIALRKRDGSVSGPYAVTAGIYTNEVVLPGALDFTPYIGGEEERTHYSFGWAETWRQSAKILSVRPLNAYTVEIECINEDINVHTIDQGVTSPVLQTSQLSSYTGAPIITTTNVVGTYLYRRQQTISWAPVAWAASYTLEYSYDNILWSKLLSTEGTSATFLLEKGTLAYVRICAYSLSKGPWKVLTITLPDIENVTGLTITTDKAGMLVTWDKCLDTDWSGTELRIGSTWEDSILIATTKGTSYIMGFQPVGTFTVWAKYRDIFNGSSAVAVSTSFTVPSIVLGTVSRSVVSSKEYYTWDVPVSIAPIVSYTVNNGSTTLEVVSTNKYSQKIDWTGTRTINITAKDAADNVSNVSSITSTIITPGPVVTPSVTYTGNSAVIQWKPPATGTLDISEYLVYSGASFGLSTLVTSVAGLSTVVSLNWLGTKQFYIVAKDVSGNASSETLLSVPVYKPLAINSIVAAPSTNARTIRISWNPTTVGNGYLPILSYEVRRGVSWDMGEEVAVTADSKLELEITWTTETTFWVAARDVNKELGATTSSSIASIVPPGVVSPTATISGLDVLLSWSVPTINSLPIAKYTIYSGDTFGTAVPISSTTGIEYSVPINWIDGKTFWVSAFDTGNNATTPINSVTATINIPSDVSLNTPIINKTNSTLDLSWGKSTASLPIAGYKISKGIDFNTSTHINTINSLSQSIPLDWVGDKTFWVSAVDIRNNEGPGVSTGAITRTILSAPSIDIQLILAKAEISWTIPTGTLPVKEYELWAGSSTSNWGDLGNTKVATVSTTNYRLPADWIGDKKFYVIGIDTSGTYGAVGNRLFTIIKPNTPTINNTTSLVGGALLDQFSLTWESSVVSTGNLPVEYYKVGYETTELARLSSNNYLAKATWLGDRTFWVTAVDLNGNESEKANKTLNISSPIAPSIKSDVIDNNVLVYWVPPIATLPIATYELSKDSTFNKSSDLYIGEKSGGFTTVFETMAGLYTYYLRAKDSAGNYGAYAQTTVSVAQPPDYILNVIWDVDKSQGIMANGVLDPSSNSIILPIDSIETYNAHFATRSGYTTFNNPGSYLMPSLGTGSYTTQVFNYGTNLAATNISVVPTVDMQGTPTATCTIYTGTDGINWPNVYTNVWTTFASNFQYVKVVINVTSTGGDDLYIIRSIDIRLDSKSKVDGNSFKVYPSSAANYNQVGTLLEVTQTSHGRSAGEYVYITGIPSPNVYKIQSSANANTFIVTAPSATSSGACTLDSDGTPTLFATSFIDVTSLMVSAQGTTPLTALYNFVDTPNPTMFKALLFNSAGVRQSGTISWSAKGY